MKFVTLFPKAEEIHLSKDVGMIPKGLSRYYGFDASLLCAGINKLPHSVDGYPDFKIENYPVFGNLYNFSVCAYLVRRSHEIDVLNLYHLDPWNYIWIILYKMFHPSGMVYLKLDMDYRNFEHLIKNVWLKRQVKEWIMKNSTVISAESRIICQKLEQKYPRLRCCYIPDGYDKTEINQDKRPEKEKIILTVGRIGTKQKATEILLEAFCRLNIEEGWKLYLAGGIEEGFSKIIKYYFSQFPDLKKRVRILGNIKNRGRLYDIYRKASVFVLPSRWESFGIVLAEAQACGCYLIASTSVPAADDLIPDEEYGSIFLQDDVIGLKEALEKAISIQDRVNRYKICRHAADEFEWEHICGKLNEFIRKEDKSRVSKGSRK